MKTKILLVLSLVLVLFAPFLIKASTHTINVVQGDNLFSIPGDSTSTPCDIVDNNENILSIENLEGKVYVSGSPFNTLSCTSIKAYNGYKIKALKNTEFQISYNVESSQNLVNTLNDGWNLIGFKDLNNTFDFQLSPICSTYEVTSLNEDIVDKNTKPKMYDAYYINCQKKSLNPDLVITDIEDKIQIGEMTANNMHLIKYIYRVKYKNIGQKNVNGNFYININETTNNFSKKINIQNNVSMNPNEERYEDILLVESGAKYSKFLFESKIDSENDINEANEENNNFNKELKVIMYDWKLSDLTLANQEFIENNDVLFSYKISNDSRATQDLEYSVDMYWNNYKIMELAYWPITDALEMGENFIYEGKLDGKYVRSGEHELKLILRLNGTDDTENNNIETRKILIKKQNSSVEYPGYYLTTSKSSYQASENLELTIKSVNENVEVNMIDIWAQKNISTTQARRYKLESNIPASNKEIKLTYDIDGLEVFNNGGDGEYSLIVCASSGCEIGKTNSISVKIEGFNSADRVYEQIRCKFKNSKTEQRCYLAGENDKFYCTGKENCNMDIYGEEGEKLTWKSTCGNYAYSKIDGVDEHIEFDCSMDSQIIKISDTASRLHENKLEEILTELNTLRDIIREQNARIKYFEKLIKGVNKIAAKMEDALNNFITYGVDNNTKKLGEGERAAVIYSYKNAFDKLPETEEELADAIKIANGRWPSITSEEAEKRAKEQFQKIYKRIADMNIASDNAAVTVMAYGLRQKAENRNLESEKNGIKTFKAIYGHHPVSTEDWNIMQAITYSGSSRGIDTDGDLLTDEREMELGTDPNNKDTDGDGYLDGIEVANGYNPLGDGKI